MVFFIFFYMLFLSDNKFNILNKTGANTKQINKSHFMGSP